MTLREALGDDARRIPELVGQRLDGEDGLIAAIGQPRVPADQEVAVRHEQPSELDIDDALAASFPASDPPGWNPGITRPVPVDTSRSRANDIRPAAIR